MSNNFDAATLDFHTIDLASRRTSAVITFGGVGDIGRGVRRPVKAASTRVRPRPPSSERMMVDACARPTLIA
jgi:hypothetical protein